MAAVSFNSHFLYPCLKPNYNGHVLVLHRKLTKRFTRPHGETTAAASLEGLCRCLEECE
jgi:hypothetical protein